MTSVPLSSITSLSFEYDDKNKSRRFRIKNRNDKYYDSDSGYGESDSDFFTQENKNKLTNDDQFLTPNRKKRKVFPQTEKVERTRKISLLKEVVPQTVQHERKRRRMHHHRHHDYNETEMDIEDQDINRPRRSSSPHKRKTTSYEVFEDKGSDIEFPEMEEITVKNQKKTWIAIEEKFTLDNIIYDIRANKWILFEEIL